jgi:hypothetical protein
VKDKNFVIIPESEDILRNPVDMNGLLAQAAARFTLGQVGSYFGSYFNSFFVRHMDNVMQSTSVVQFYNRFQGHTTDSYIHTTSMLPDTLYQGENLPDLLLKNNNSDELQKTDSSEEHTVYKKVKKHPSAYQDKSGKVFSLHHSGQMHPMNRIQGFIFYKDPSVLNQVVIY